LSLYQSRVTWRGLWLISDKKDNNNDWDSQNIGLNEKILRHFSFIIFHNNTGNDCSQGPAHKIPKHSDSIDRKSFFRWEPSIRSDCSEAKDAHTRNSNQSLAKQSDLIGSSSVISDPASKASQETSEDHRPSEKFVSKPAADRTEDKTTIKVHICEKEDLVLVCNIEISH